MEPDDGKVPIIMPKDSTEKNMPMKATKYASAGMPPDAFDTPPKRLNVAMGTMKMRP